MEGGRGGGLALCGEGLTRLPRTPTRAAVLRLPGPREDTFFFCTCLFCGGTAILLAAALICEPRTGNRPSRANIQPAGTPSPRTTVKRTLTFPQGPGRVVSHAIPASAQRPTLTAFAVRLAASGAGSKDSKVPASPAGSKCNFGATGPCRGRREVIQDGS